MNNDLDMVKLQCIECKDTIEVDREDAPSFTKPTDDDKDIYKCVCPMCYEKWSKFTAYP